MINQAQFQKSAEHHDRMKALMHSCLMPFVATATMALFVLMIALLIISMGVVADIAGAISTAARDASLHPIQSYAQVAFSWGWKVFAAIMIAAVLVGSVLHLWIDLTWPRN